MRRPRTRLAGVSGLGSAANARRTASALSSPATRYTSRPHAANTGGVIVTRGTSGSSPGSAATARRSVSSRAGAPGKSEAVWPSGPIPFSAKSSVTPSSSAS